MTDQMAQSQRRYFGGVCALIAVVVIWVSSSFAMNSIFGEQNYNKPFLVTYLNTTTFTFYLIPLFFRRKRTSASVPDEYTKLLNDVSAINNSNGSAPHHTYMTPITPENHCLQQSMEKLSTAETVKLSLAFCILWFLANYTTNASLAYTSVASSTILASTSGLFTLAIGAMFGVERLTLIRVASVCVCFLGVVFVSYSDQTLDDQESDPTKPSSAPLIGDLLALGGAFCYGCYTTMLKLRIGDESRINMPLFFGFVGAFNIVLLWPLFPIFHWTGVETFEIPHGGILWATLLLNAFVGTFLSDYLWLVAMLMTSPLVVTLGISLTIPLALMGDIVFKGAIPSFYYAIGASMVVIGFFAVNMAALSDVDIDTERQGHQSTGPDHPAEASSLPSSSTS